MALAVCQWHPKDLNKVVTYTLETEPYISLAPAHVASVAVTPVTSNTDGACLKENHMTIAAMQVRQGLS